MSSNTADTTPNTSDTTTDENNNQLADTHYESVIKDENSSIQQILVELHISEGMISKQAVVAPLSMTDSYFYFIPDSIGDDLINKDTDHNPTEPHLYDFTDQGHSLMASMIENKELEPEAIRHYQRRTTNGEDDADNEGGDEDADEPFECQLCGKRFSTASDARRHVTLSDSDGVHDGRNGQELGAIKVHDTLGSEDPDRYEGSTDTSADLDELFGSDDADTDTDADADADADSKESGTGKITAKNGVGTAESYDGDGRGLVLGSDREPQSIKERPEKPDIDFEQDDEPDESDDPDEPADSPENEKYEPRTFDPASDSDDADFNPVLSVDLDPSELYAFLTAEGNDGLDHLRKQMFAEIATTSKLAVHPTDIDIE